MIATDVVLDAIGSPEMLTLASVARFVKLQQKDLDAVTTLPFRVYPPDSTTSYEYVKAEEPWEVDLGKYMAVGTRVAQAETVSSSATFVLIEK